MNPNKKVKIVEKDLSFIIVGILFHIHTTLGNRYHEKYYQRAISLDLQKNKIPFEEQIKVDLLFDGHDIGKYILDFVIDKRIVLEIKAIPRFHPNDFRQISAYLKAKNIELGILANFRTEKLEYKRILNPDFLHSD